MSNKTYKCFENSDCQSQIQFRRQMRDVHRYRMSTIYENDYYENSESHNITESSENASSAIENSNESSSSKNLGCDTSDRYENKSDHSSENGNGGRRMDRDENGQRRGRYYNDYDEYEDEYYCEDEFGYNTESDVAPDSANDSYEVREYYEYEDSDYDDYPENDENDENDEPMEDICEENAVVPVHYVVRIPCRAIENNCNPDNAETCDDGRVALYNPFEPYLPLIIEEIYCCDTTFAEERFVKKFEEESDSEEMPNEEEEEEEEEGGSGSDENEGVEENDHEETDHDTDDESSNEPADETSDDIADETSIETSDEPVYETSDEPSDKTSDEPPDVPTDESADKRSDECDEESDNETSDEPPDVPTDESTGEISDENALVSSEEIVYETSSNETSDESSNEPAEETSDELGDESSDMSSDDYSNASFDESDYETANEEMTDEADYKISDEHDSEISDDSVDELSDETINEPPNDMSFGDDTYLLEDILDSVILRGADLEMRINYEFLLHYVQDSCDRSLILKINWYRAVKIPIYAPTAVLTYSTRPLSGQSFVFDLTTGPSTVDIVRFYTHLSYSGDIHADSIIRILGMKQLKAAKSWQKKISQFEIFIMELLYPLGSIFSLGLVIYYLMNRAEWNAEQDLENRKRFYFF